jgi:hypothetical protein
MSLEQEQKTYEREREKLMASAGKFVLIHGDEVHGVYDTYSDALQVGYEKYGLKPFLVKQIEMVQQAHCFTRDLSLCPT